MNYGNEINNSKHKTTPLNVANCKFVFDISNIQSVDIMNVIKYKLSFNFKITMVLEQIYIIKNVPSGAKTCSPSIRNFYGKHFSDHNHK